MSDPLLIGTYVALAVGVVCLLWGFRGLMRTARILADGGISTGRVAETQLNGEGEAYITLEFITDHDFLVQFKQKAPVMSTPLFRKNRQVAFFTGREYKVFYNRTTPAHASVSPGLDVFYSLIMIGFGLLFWLVVGKVWLA
ncbi:MAG: DUF3592 domain-containing protein [Pseudomonadota bacterium]